MNSPYWEWIVYYQTYDDPPKYGVMHTLWHDNRSSARRAAQSHGVRPRKIIPVVDPVALAQWMGRPWPPNLTHHLDT